MIPSNLQVRRATVEDVPRLAEFWNEEGLPSEELARRFQEFQVVERGEEGLLGTVGLRLAGTEGRLHSEAFASAEYADLVRDAVWQRVQVIAKNHGLVRVWTQLNAPFWHLNGFLHPAPEIAARLPAAFAGDPRPWRFVQLREETAAPVSFDKEFAMFREMEQEKTAQVFRRAKFLKLIAALLLLVVFALILVGAFVWFKTQGARR